MGLCVLSLQGGYYVAIWNGRNASIVLKGVYATEQAAWDAIAQLRNKK
jgi:septal ring-binding cell division protein DamX